MNTLFSNFKQLALVAATAFLSVHAVADTKEQIVFSKYLKYSFCMEKSFGRPWAEKSKLQTVMTRWSAQEPTLRAITAASPEVKAKDKLCRLETGKGLRGTQDYIGPVAHLILSSVISVALLGLHTLTSRG